MAKKFEVDIVHFYVKLFELVYFIGKLGFCH